MHFKTRLGALRYNNRMEKLWADCRALEAKRLASGERPNPNLTAIAQCKCCDAFVCPAYAALPFALHANAAGTKDDPRPPGDWDDICDRCGYDPVTS